MLATLLKIIGNLMISLRGSTLKLMLLLILAFGGVVYFLYNVTANDKIEQVQDLKQELNEAKLMNKALQHDRDSLITKDYNDKMEIYKKLEYYISTQEHNKKVLRSK